MATRKVSDFNIIYVRNRVVSVAKSAKGTDMYRSNSGKTGKHRLAHTLTIINHAILILLLIGIHSLCVPNLVPLYPMAKVMPLDTLAKLMLNKHSKVHGRYIYSRMGVNKPTQLRGWQVDDNASYTALWAYNPFTNYELTMANPSTHY